VKRLIAVLGVVVLVAAAGATLLQSGSGGSALAGRVTYVIDGDTVVVRLDSGESEHVRLIGIDTPEIAHDGRPGECYGAAASRLTRRLALGRRVSLEPGRERRDRYGRLLAYVQVDGGPDDLERTVLDRGAARTLAIPPNVDRAAVYDEVERAARRAGRGLWGACGE
jgi:micrococcal nuclease